MLFCYPKLPRWWKTLKLFVAIFVVASLFNNGCQKNVGSVDAVSLIGSMNRVGLTDSLNEFEKQPSKQTIVPVFQWCAMASSLELSNFSDELFEETTLEINGVRVRLFQLKEYAIEYCETLEISPDRSVLETLMVLEGMLVLGQALEASVSGTSDLEAAIKLVGMGMQQKSLPLLEANAEEFGFDSLRESIENEKLNVTQRFKAYANTLLSNSEN